MDMIQQDHIDNGIGIGMIHSDHIGIGIGIGMVVSVEPYFKLNLIIFCSNETFPPFLDNY